MFYLLDEIHRLNKVIEEYLYSAMEDFKIDLMIDQDQVHGQYNKIKSFHTY